MIGFGFGFEYSLCVVVVVVQVEDEVFNNPKVSILVNTALLKSLPDPF